MTREQATVYVVDDDVSVLRSLGRMFEIAGYVVRTFAHPRELLERVPEGLGCAVLDLRMPDLNGLELQEALTRVGCAMPVVLISGHGDIPAAVQAMKAGAVDFLPKPVRSSDLLNAVERALAQHASAREAMTEREAIRARFAALTPRERDVCRLLAQGLQSKEIAVELGTAEQTVRLQRARAMEKLKVHSVVNLARMVALLGE